MLLSVSGAEIFSEKARVYNGNYTCESVKGRSVYKKYIERSVFAFIKWINTGRYQGYVMGKSHRDQTHFEFRQKPKNSKCPHVDVEIWRYAPNKFVPGHHTCFRKDTTGRFNIIGY